jgi:hypothetical protein
VKLSFPARVRLLIDAKGIEVDFLDPLEPGR